MFLPGRRIIAVRWARSANASGQIWSNANKAPS